ncbi:unnamed protein product [Medioppia subpectinata]|uniref:Amidase domain-containing protein n=1 Tax=Medioppia subpectinata TaxID=1979941 RepID=A0A7R9LIL1_9ACAR|nr:unnamed protein product [Medioppia subpectinata]CAG2119065.1 unnamed protein product [Medioppia subpectinata]
MVDFNYYTKRLIRIFIDIFVNLIGLLYPSTQRYLPPITDGLLLESVTNLVKRIKTGKLKSEDVIKAYIKRIKEVQPHINAVIDERYDEAIIDAIEVDKRVAHELHGNEPLNGVSIHSQPLLGIPFSGKDCIGIKNMLITAGTAARKTIRATEDAAMVRNLRNAGAIPVCMTNVPELMLWWNTDNKIFGQTYNPYDKSIIPGGSSGGNAALVSAAGSLLGIGSDIGGSIRMPSFFCGLFGHCTTPELIPADNHWPPTHAERFKLLSFGPMVRYATDIKPTLKAFVGNNVSKLKLDESVDLSRLKVHYMYAINDPLLTPVSAETRKGIDECVQHLKSLGATVKEINLDKLKHSFLIWQFAMTVKGVTPLAEELTNRNGAINPRIEILKSLYGGSDHTFQALYVAYVTGKPVAEQVLQKYNKIREELRREVYEILGDDGILLFPTHPDSCVKLNATLFNSGNVCYTMAFNCLRVAITQVPLGLNSNRLPLGVQVIAKPFNDHLTIAVAEEFERRFGGWVPPTRVNI